MTTLTLIETGGTICMEAGPEGLRPAPDQVAGLLRRLAPGQEIDAQALRPLVDSAEVGPALWNALLDRIAAAPGAVIITHGTDTMAYTGAALDAALVGQTRSVVLCGSMRPLSAAGSDGSSNLALALRAAHDNAPGVSLAFAGHLMPAGVLSKTHSQADAAFQIVGDVAAPEMPPCRRFDETKSLAVVTISPGMSARSLAAALDGLDGAVLRVFGAGTAPAHLSPVIEKAARTCEMVAISQCMAGGLAPGAYAAGAALWAAGVENGGLQSVEQALTRLWLRLSISALAA